MNEMFINNYLKIIRYCKENSNEIVKNVRIFKNEEFKNNISITEEETIKDFRNILVNINDYIFSEAALKCIEKFLNSEIDYSTPGIRGMGRMSTHIPRFGGYYAKYLIKLNSTDIGIIKSIIKDILNFGYYISVQLEAAEKKIKKFPEKAFDTLLNEWIPTIYVQKYEKGLENFLLGNAIFSQYYFCIKLSKESKFPPKFLKINRMGSDKLSLIIRKYIDAGFNLRVNESEWVKSY